MRLVFVFIGLCTIILFTPLMAQAGNEDACAMLQSCMDTCPNHETGAPTACGTTTISQ